MRIKKWTHVILQFFSLARRHPVLELLCAFSVGNLLDLCEFTLLVIRVSCWQAKSWSSERTVHDPRYTPASRPVLKRIPGLGVALGRNRGRRRVFRKNGLVSSSPLAWEIPWTEEPGRLQSMGLQRVEHDWATTLLYFSSQLATPALAGQEIF